ncbi:hypothetical protein JCM14202_400 [Agrilactobacillus composti DSM 18527 = JCM 14202]|uniref:MoaD/ThiS family protein n=1 Tax=Agrilactobacillus composti TaxID=398555 RepID=UPI00042DE699|nr:hypothetical protein [Agrilactobacillus composti]GAF38584.1 hypothetical protein JCM14202_400 [Agrilactobacillus composti DSM 18527 = JCM 14202]
MIKIKLFAYLQEMVDANEIEVAFANDTPTTADLKQAVAGAYPVVAAYLRRCAWQWMKPLWAKKLC